MNDIVAHLDTEPDMIKMFEEIIWLTWKRKEAENLKEK